MNFIGKFKYAIKGVVHAVKQVEGSKILTFIDVLWCGIRYGASPSNYENFDFKHANASQRNTFLTHRRNNFLMKKFNSENEIWKLQNKYEFAKIMGSQYGRLYANSLNVTIEDLQRIIESSRIIYKPIKGGQGIGIEVFEQNQLKDLKELVDILHKLPEGIVEQWIIQDKRMSSLYPDAVNPVRIQSLFTNEVHIIAATITIANGTKIANASGVKAIFALIDVSTGRVLTDGYDYNCNTFTVHPITGIKIKGFMIPDWDKVVNLIKTCGMKFEYIRHIGWDVAISEHGPVIIEANNDPGYTAYQLPYFTKSHKGIWAKYKVFLR